MKFIYNIYKINSSYNALGPTYKMNSPYTTWSVSYVYKTQSLTKSGTVSRY